MCIIVLDPNTKDTKHLSDKTIGVCETNNPHGMGIAYFHSDNKLKIYKTLDDLDGIIKRYDLGVSSGKPILLHFRIKTHGDISKENCHPFIASSKKIVVAHNGVITPLAANREISDTKRFMETIVNKLPDDAIWNNAVQALMSQYIGNSKLVFLDVKGNYTIVNEDLGEWDGGIWFSNLSFMPIHTYKKKKKESFSNGHHSGWGSYGSFYKKPKYKKPKYGNPLDDVVWVKKDLTCIGCLDFSVSKKDIWRVYSDTIEDDDGCIWCGYIPGSYSNPEIVALRNNGMTAEKFVFGF